MAQRKKQPTSTVSGAKTHYEGLGYYVPAGYTLQEIQKLASEWNAKLQKSGHVDIESFSDVLMGLSSPYLRGQRSYKSLQSHHDPSEALDYIQTYINLYMHTSKARWKYGKSHAIALFLLNCYVNQVEFRDISKLSNTGDVKAFKRKHPSVEFPTYFQPTTMYKSHYWAYQYTRKLLQHCWLWHITDINGELTAEQLSFYGFVGLDVVGTNELYNKALQELGREPIKLRKPESKY
jgi:hypothetical protein